VLYRIIRIRLGAIVMKGEKRKYERKRGMTIIVRIPVRTRICWRVMRDNPRGVILNRMMLLGSMLRIYILLGVWNRRG